MSEERRAVPVAIDGSGAEVAVAPASRDASLARRRMALRIPDDEVARPQMPTPEAMPRPEVSSRPDMTPRPDAVVMPPPPEDAAPLTPMRIITISEPPPAVEDAVSNEAALAVDLPGPATPRVLALEVEEEVDVRFEDDPPTPITPRVEVSVADEEPAGEPKRPSDAPDELAAEDVVTLEPPPARPIVVSTLPPMRPRLASQPPVPPPSPSKRPLVVPSSAPRPALVIVPPHVGSVPSVQPEGPGQRRKGRLWWEELFNDDYLRTSEKIGDAQIAREATFIEESLGVERGAAVLDLGCGTGRHAIELARRGSEVVGFDLSLAMLARA
jgi:hypothetical protein